MSVKGVFPSYTPMRHALLSLAAALALVTVGGCDSGSDGPVQATATVTNTFGRPLAGGTVVVEPAGGAGNKTAGQLPLCTTTTSSTGAFTCDLPPGTYTVTITVPGYSTGSFPITVGPDGTITVDLPPLTGQGNIDGTMVDGVTGAVLTFATVQCRRRLPDGTYTEFEFEATTGADGRITIQNVFAGDAQCVVQAGASQIPITITITPDTRGTIAVTPPPAVGQYRIVLTWGADPSDLDSHLTGPTGTGNERYHVYFGDRTYVTTAGDTLAVLDTDDTGSFGPETTTFTPAANGVYRFTVFNYTLRSSTEGGQSIHDSPTRVQVYDSNGLRQTYEAPPPTTANEGLIANAWRVVQLTKQGSQITLSGVASAPPDQVQPGLLYVLANGSTDVGTFFTGRFPDGKPLSL